MSPITHFLAGWALAHTAKLNPRERMLVSVAGVIPDLDGFGIVVDFATRGATDWWENITMSWGTTLVSVCSSPWASPAWRSARA